MGPITTASDCRMPTALLTTTSGYRMANTNSSSFVCQRLPIALHKGCQELIFIEYSYGNADLGIIIINGNAHTPRHEKQPLEHFISVALLAIFA